MERRSRKERRERQGQTSGSKEKFNREFDGTFDQDKEKEVNQEETITPQLPNKSGHIRKEVHSSKKQFERKQIDKQQFVEKPSHKNKKQRKNFSGIMITILLLVIVIAISYIALAKPFDKKTTVATSTARKSSSIFSSNSSSTSSSSSSTKASKAWLNTSAENYLPTLMYHNVSADTPNSNFVTPTNLESVLQAIKADSVYTVSSDEALKILTTNTKPADKLIWLTFDDGYQDFYVNAFPLLKKYNLHATSFVITGKVGQAGYLTADEIKEMAKSGLVDFQSHTVNHVSLDTDDATQTSELQQSKAYMDTLLNQKTHVICYPSGSHNADTGPIATSLGYDMGLLDPGRTYNGETAANAAAKGSDGLFKLNRYRTFTETDGTAVRAMIADDEAYNVSNTAK